MLLPLASRSAVKPGPQVWAPARPQGIPVSFFVLEPDLLEAALVRPAVSGSFAHGNDLIKIPGRRLPMK